MIDVVEAPFSWCLSGYRGQHTLLHVLKTTPSQGKTVQVCSMLGYISAVEEVPGSDAPGPFLIVAPASVIGNWKRELGIWCPRLRVGEYRGGAARFLKQRELAGGQRDGGPAMAAAGRSAATTSSNSDSNKAGVHSRRAVAVVVSSDDDDHSDEGRNRAAHSGDVSAAESSSLDASGDELDEEENDGESESSAASTAIAVAGSSNGYKVKTQRGFDVLLVTFTLFDKTGSGALADRSWLRRFAWDTVVLDEGQAIRNSDKQRHVQLSALRAKHRLLLSGTPVQNNLRELFALLRFLLPVQFDRAAERACVAAAAAADASSPQTVGSTSVEGVTLVPQLRRILAPFVLRRGKRDVLTSLASKTEVVVRLALDGAQGALYRTLVADARAAAASAPVLALRTAQSLFTDLRKAAAHPLLLRRIYFTDDVTLDAIGNALWSAGAFGTDASCTRDRVRSYVRELSDFELHMLCVQYLPSSECVMLGGYTQQRENVVTGARSSSEFEALAAPVTPFALDHSVLVNRRAIASCKLPRAALTGLSCKSLWLARQLPKLVQEGHRILIFSGWTTVLDILEQVLEHCLALPFARLDGSTPVDRRQTIIDTFTQRDGAPIFLLSTKAGGLGLNLTAADTVVIFDSSFNPHDDAQAIDRVHRIGQTRPVTVYRLVAEGTADDAIYRLAVRKQALDLALRGGSDGLPVAVGNSSSEAQSPSAVDLLAAALQIPDNSTCTIDSLSDSGPA